MTQTIHQEQEQQPLERRVRELLLLQAPAKKVNSILDLEQLLDAGGLAKSAGCVNKLCRHMKIVRNLIRTRIDGAAMRRVCCALKTAATKCGPSSPPRRKVAFGTSSVRNLADFSALVRVMALTIFQRPITDSESSS